MQTPVSSVLNIAPSKGSDIDRAMQFLKEAGYTTSPSTRSAVAESPYFNSNYSSAAIDNRVVVRIDDEYTDGLFRLTGVQKEPNNTKMHDKLAGNICTMSLDSSDIIEGLNAMITFCTIYKVGYENFIHHLQNPIIGTGPDPGFVQTEVRQIRDHIGEGKAAKMGYGEYVNIFESIPLLLHSKPDYVAMEQRLHDIMYMYCKVFWNKNRGVETSKLLGSIRLDHCHFGGAATKHNELDKLIDKLSPGLRTPEARYAYFLDVINRSIEHFSQTDDRAGDLLNTLQ